MGVVGPHHDNRSVEDGYIHHVRSYVVNSAYLCVDLLEDVS